MNNINITDKDIYNPKNGPVWKSGEYRRWIRRHKSCLSCGKELLDEKETFLTHHHRHSGGKNPRDQLLVPMCLFCHNNLHANESLFYSTKSMEELDLIALMTLIEFLNENNDGLIWALLNTITEVDK